MSQEQILTNFYTAVQKSSESIAEWSCRLEDILSHPKVQLRPEQREEMLKTRFFKGLYHEKVQDAIRHKVDSKGYDDLLVLAREAEDETKTEKAVARPQIEDDLSKKFDTLIREFKDFKEKISGWETRIQHLEKKGMGNTTNNTKNNNEDHNKDKPNFTCNYCKAPGHTKKTCTKLDSKRSTDGYNQ